jgi:UDP-glucose 4-epimerase
MKYALITGANGFIGRHLCQSLLMSGVKIKKHVRLEDPFDKCEQYECDLELNEFSKKALNGIDVVYHLAGLAHDVKSTSLNLNQYQTVNVHATIKIATIAAEQKIKHFVFISSVKAGGASIPGECISEDCQSEPQGIYAQTKRDAEIKLLEIGRLTGMKVTIIRPALVYGPNVKGNLELMLLGIRKGWFLPISDAGNIRSMIHVDDLVRALIFVTNNINVDEDIYIATDGCPHSTRELYEAMCNSLGKKVPSWSIPSSYLNILSLLSRGMKNKVNKLLGDDCYSSGRLQALGFKADRTLNEINETNF